MKYLWMILEILRLLKDADGNGIPDIFEKHIKTNDGESHEVAERKNDEV